MAQEGSDAYVATAMNRDFASLPPAMDLADAMPLIAQSGNCALVMEEGKLLGILTSENLAEFLVLRRIGMRQRE